MGVEFLKRNFDGTLGYVETFARFNKGVAESTSNIPKYSILKDLVYYFISNYERRWYDESEFRATLSTRAPTSVCCSLLLLSGTAAHDK